MKKKKKKKQLQGAVKGRGVVARRVYRRRKKVYLSECLRWCQRLVSLNDCPIFQGLIVDTYKAYPWPLCIFNAHGRSGLVLCTRVPNYLPPPPSIKIPDSRILDENKTSWTRYPLSYSPITLSPLLSLSSFSSFHLTFRRDVCEVLVGKISLSQNFWNLKAYLGDNRGEYRYIFPSSFFLFSSSSSSFPKRLQRISLSSFRIFDLTLNLEDDVMFFRQNGKKIFRMERKCKEFYNSSILYYVHLHNYQRMSNLFEYRLKIIPPKNFSPTVYCSNLSHMRRYRQSKLHDIRRSSEPP